MGLPSLVVTLAGLIGWRGAARILVEDRSIGDFPSWFENLGQEPVIGRFSFALIFFLVEIVLAGIVLHRTAFGRAVFVIGNNANVARYSGVERGPGQDAHHDHVGLHGRRWRGSCSRPGSARSAAIWPPASSSTSSRWSCSAA